MIIAMRNHDPSFLGVWVGLPSSGGVGPREGIGEANSQLERADPNLEKEGPTPTAKVRREK